MDKVELHIQKRFVKTFQELKQELEQNNSKVMATGWQQRNELISHVYSGYTNDEALNNKREKHQRYIQRANVMKWIYERLQEQRDLYGYFENPQSIIEILNNLIEEAVSKELYEIAGELNNWRKKLIA